MVWVKLTNFTEDEFKCRCEDENCYGRMNATLLIKLQNLRFMVDHPLKISSGLRCRAHNEKVGGAKNSPHLHGLAVDIDTKFLDSSQEAKLIKYAMQVGFTGVGFYTGHLHLDVRPPHRVWMEWGRSKDGHNKDY